ncbi:hypothetical protein FZX15_05490 [Brucella suis bv. 1]|nr:hypothetical protein FZX15_05490 [Brucella suis bv. 1]
MASGGDLRIFPQGYPVKFQQRKDPLLQKRVIVETKPRPKTEKIAFHRKIEDLPITFGQIAIDTAPAAIDNKDGIGPVPCLETIVWGG